MKRDNYNNERSGAYIKLGNHEEGLGFIRIEDMLDKVLKKV